jgi:RNA-directed DNA polymerase
MSRKQLKTQLCLAFMSAEVGEAQQGGGEGTMRPMAGGNAEDPESTEQLMEEICEPANVQKAVRRVQQNGGSAGVDGMTVQELPGYVFHHWPAVRDQLLRGTYVPQPVRRVRIPKRTGGTRVLGIPTVLDRVIQQAVLQCLQPRWDPTFSDHSFGFRPRRSAHQAVARAQSYVAEGYRWVVDMDLEKFFDRVNHDQLMGQVAKRVEDPRVRVLIRAFLNAGVLAQGLVSPTREGTPQGGPLSPLLSNLMLDTLDRELERRGHCFVRYADDCNVYVRSARAGQRVFQSLRRFVGTKLKLRIHEGKSAVARVPTRSFLGFRVVRGSQPKRGLGPEAVKQFRHHVRQLTRRTRGISMAQMVTQVSRYLLGWQSYFGYCETPTVLDRLNSWIRRRLRAVLWKQWRRGDRRFAELRRLGVRGPLAAATAGSAHGPWHLSRSQAVQVALPGTFFDTLGLPRLAVRKMS